MSANENIARGISGLSALLTGIHTRFKPALKAAPFPVKLTVNSVLLAESVLLNAASNDANGTAEAGRITTTLVGGAVGAAFGGVAAQYSPIPGSTIVLTALGSFAIGELAGTTYDFFEAQSYTVAEATAAGEAIGDWLQTIPDIVEANSGSLASDPIGAAQQIYAIARQDLINRLSAAGTNLGGDLAAAVSTLPDITVANPPALVQPESSFLPISFQVGDLIGEGSTQTAAFLNTSELGVTSGELDFDLNGNFLSGRFTSLNGFSLTPELDSYLQSRGVTPEGLFDWSSYEFDINPATAFAQNSTILNFVEGGAEAHVEAGTGLRNLQIIENPGTDGLYGEDVLGIGDIAFEGTAADGTKREITVSGLTTNGANTEGVAEQSEMVAIAPFGKSEEMLADLRANVFKGQSFKLHRLGPDGKRHVEVMRG